MKVFQSHALNRMIQVFLLKAQSLSETEKVVYVYNILLKILKMSANDRKAVILTDFLEHLRVNAYREFCWLDSSSPLFIEIYSRITLVDEVSRQSNDSQGNSSGSDSVSHTLNRNAVRLND